MLKIHVVGDWLPEEVRTRWVESGRSIVPEVERLIEEAWTRVVERQGVRLFDGPICRLERWSMDGAILCLDISRTSYKPFLGTNLEHPELADRFGPAVFANPVGVSTALLTTDRYLLFGRRNASVAYYPNRTHPFAGSLEPRDALNIFAATRRELAEELSLGEADLAEVRLIGLVEDERIRHPELIFRADTPLTRSQVEAQVDDAEHHATVAIAATESAIMAALEDESLTPVAVASLLLWGRLSLGEKWFEEGKSRMENANIEHPTSNVQRPS